jgi:hypothetical protein
MRDINDQNRTIDLFAADKLCPECSRPLSVNPRGRSPVCCSSSCKQAAYRFRKNDFCHQRVSSRLKMISAAALVEQRQDLILPLRNDSCVSLTLRKDGRQL